MDKIKCAMCARIAVFLMALFCVSLTGASLAGAASPVADDLVVATSEDTALGGTLTASDGDGDILSFRLDTQAASGTAVVNSDGSYSYTPAANYHGPDSFTFIVNDSTTDSNIATVSITVTPVADVPVADDLEIATDEDTALGGALTASDGDGDLLTFRLGSQAANGTAVVNSDGSYSYTPVANYHGPDSFTFIVNDGTADSNIGTVTVTVNPVADNPVADNLAVATDEDTVVNGNLTASDGDNDVLTFSLGTQAVNG
ncbi:MAG: tandem-95 repeat protein, partial [Deltaproteobacteria bacterium]|nr:tandem-95 repeat protein [Deltaproteobacteria bacterium]